MHMKRPMPHTVKTDPINGLIEVAMVGEVNPKNLVELMASIVHQSTLLADQQVAVKILVDFSRLDKFNVPLKTIAASGMKDLGFRKMAGYGAPAWLRHFTNSVAFLAGKTHSTRNFSTRAEALKWLDE
jgi:hypothetical protein